MRLSIFNGGALLALMAVAVIFSQASALPRMDPNFQDAFNNCSESDCITPECRCSSTETPDGLDPEDIPQFVLLSFDDAVTISNFPLYQELSTYKNPNGCPIRMTFYVSHENTDYSLVNQLYTLGHELASHTVSLSTDTNNYWSTMSEETYADEISGVRDMMQLYGLVPPEEVKGFRASLLYVGGNTMFKALQDEGFLYDCSWPTLQYTSWYSGPLGAEPLGVLWPYTLDYLSVQEQTIGVKPTDSFPGLWVNPMTDLRDNRGVECPLLDQCQGVGDELETSSQAVFDMLQDNFDRHLFGSRAPFGLYTRESWFANSTSHQEGFQMFMDYISQWPQVYVISVSDIFDWVKDPVSYEDIDDFENVQCTGSYPPSDCTQTFDCPYTENLPIDQEEVYMKICGAQSDCPEVYPWVGNPTGSASKKPIV